MVRIAPVNLYYNPKTLWFDAGDLNIYAGDGLVLSTARGVEFGRASGDVFEATDEQVEKLKSPLKPVLRIASEEDEAQALEMDVKSAEALPIFRQMAAESNEEMRPISVEYLFDGDKAVFYFEAEDRVDFRELVRKLAAHFRIRIDMRQIGVRDEARMVGGLGHCGQELCCKRLGGEFCPVSIRMAKEQDLSLNPQKISGVCGRLMCCLRYEFDAYKDFKSRAPKQNSQVETPEGPAKVVELDVPREIVTLKVEGEKPIRVPLADFDPPEEGSSRPRSVGKQAWEDALNAAAVGTAGGAAIFSTERLTGKDKLADPMSIRHTGCGAHNCSSASALSVTKGASEASDKTDKQATSTAGRKPRRRRSTKVGVRGGVSETTEAKRRQGQVSVQKKASSSERTKQGSAKKQQLQQTGTEVLSKRGQKRKQHMAVPAQENKPAARPGQKSSGLRQKPGQQKQARQVSRVGQKSSASNASKSGNTGRKPRRRTHHASGASDKPASNGKNASGNQQ